MSDVDYLSAEQIRALTNDQLADRICKAWRARGRDDRAEESGASPYRNTDPTGWERWERRRAESELECTELQREVLRRLALVG